MKGLGNQFLVGFFIVFVLGFLVIDISYGDHTITNVEIPSGTSVPGCELENKCYIEDSVVIDVFSEVIWTNVDSAAHTVTSGNSLEGPDGLFDSGLISVGESFSYQFTGVGFFDYYCIVHPWMIGSVNVLETFENSSEIGDSILLVDDTHYFPFSETASIVIPFSEDSHDCKDLENCFLPINLTVEEDTLVTWYNLDDNSRLIKSGNPEDGPDGLFDSGMLEPDQSFSFRFEEPKVYEYYDEIHQWEVGTITVIANEIDRENKITKVMGSSSDGSIFVHLESMNPTASKATGIHTQFLDKENSVIKHVNYDMKITQDGKPVLNLPNQHSHAGFSEHWTDKLESDNPLDISITILGVGLPGQEESWTGPKGEIIMFQIVPEFGIIVGIILAIAIMAGIVFSSKSNLNIIPRF